METFFCVIMFVFFSVRWPDMNRSVFLTCLMINSVWVSLMIGTVCLDWFYYTVKIFISVLQSLQTVYLVWTVQVFTSLLLSFIILSIISALLWISSCSSQETRLKPSPQVADILAFYRHVHRRQLFIYLLVYFVYNRTVFHQLIINPSLSLCVKSLSS